MAVAISQLPPVAAVGDADVTPIVQSAATGSFTALLMRIIRVYGSGALTGYRNGVNFIPGASTQITLVDDPTNNKVDVTIGSTAVPNNDSSVIFYKFSHMG